MMENSFEHMRGSPSTATTSTPDLKSVSSKGEPYARIVREKLGLSQDDFSSKFGIPIKLLNDWESGAVTPPHYSCIYLRLIDANPDYIEKTLKERVECH